MSFQRFEKIEWESVEHLMSLPAPKRHTVDCPNCNFRHPVMPEYMDWKEVAERYRQSHSGMVNAFMRLFKEAGDVFDVPLMEYYEASQLELKQLLRELLDKSKEVQR